MLAALTTTWSSNPRVSTSTCRLLDPPASLARHTRLKTEVVLTDWLSTIAALGRCRPTDFSPQHLIHLLPNPPRRQTEVVIDCLPRRRKSVLASCAKVQSHRIWKCHWALPVIYLTGRPPVFAAGIVVIKIAHCLSVESLGYNHASPAPAPAISGVIFYTFRHLKKCWYCSKFS